jgi:hypothetical protein
MNYDTQEIKRSLRSFVAQVTFTKKDGSTRVMNCTLRPDIVPPVVTEATRTKKVNDAVCPVWDIDAQAWRSFRYDAITHIEVNGNG